MAIVAGLLAIVVAAAALLAHAPFVRAAVLRYVLATVEREYGLHLEASRLDYNLAALRVGLADLRLSAPHAPDEPLLTAEYISAEVPWRALLGTISLDDLTVTNARVLVRRRPDGTTNLPSPSSSPGGDPSPLNVRRIAVPQIAIDVRDEQSATFFWIPSLAILLTPDDGYVKLQRPAEFHTETQLTALRTIAGGARFDGRALHLVNLQVQADEGDVQLDGAVTLLARDPGVDLRVRGTVDATRVARWVVTDGPLPRGAVRIDVRARGAFDRVETDLNLASDRLDWQDLTGTDIITRAHVTAAGAEVQQLRLGFAGGDVQATAAVPFVADGAGHVQASWQSVDVASAMSRVAPSVRPLPSAALSGELAAEGIGTDMMAWSGSAKVAFVPGSNAPGRVAVAGNADIRLRDRHWELNAKPTIGGVAPVSASLRGDFEDQITGTVALGDTPLQQLIALVRTTGIADIGSDVSASGDLRADLNVSGSLRDPVVQGRASVRDLAVAQATAPLVEAEFSGRPSEPDLEFSVAAPDLVVAEQRVADMRARGRLVSAVLVRQGPSGMYVFIDDLSAMQPGGPGRLTGKGTYDVADSRYVLSVEGGQWYVSGLAGQPVEAVVELMFAGEGSVGEPYGAGQLTLRDARWQGETLGAIDASFKVEGETVNVVASAPEFALELWGRIGLNAPYNAQLVVPPRELDLARLTRGVQTPVPVTGSVHLSLNAELPLEDWRRGIGTLDVESLQAMAGELPVTLSSPARIRYEGERAHIDRLDVAAGGIALSASGSLPVFDAAPDNPVVLVTAAGDVNAVVEAAVSAGFTSLPPAVGTGPFGLLGRVTGTVVQPVVAADLDVGPGSITAEGLRPVTSIRVRAHAEDGWIELREGDAEYEGAQVSVTGKAPVSLLTGWAGPTGEAVVHARATNLTSAVLTPWVGASTVDELEGSVDLTLDAATPSADLAALTGELRIDRLDVRVADLPVTQRVPTRIVARDGFARVEAWDWVGQGATLGVRGQIRLEDRQAAILANGVVDLRVLTPFVRTAGMTTAGRLEPRLSITGSLDSPRIDGDAVLTGGELRLADPRVLVTDLTVRSVLTRGTARITELTGSVNGGALTGGGALEYTAERGAEAQFTTNIQGMALEYPEGLRTEIDAALDLTMTSPPAATGDPLAGRLAGTVTLRRGSYREPLAVVGGVLAGLRARQLATTAQPSPVLDALSLDVRVVTDEDLVVDNNYGRFELGGDLRVIGTAASPALSGRAELREGGQLFVGRNVYSINFGAIDFASATAIEPNLNVEATTRAGGEDIQVTITGPAEGPSVDLRSTSNPELGQAEVASLLLTGRTLETLDPGDAAFVGTQVLGNFSAEVLGFAGRAVGFDTLRLGGVEGAAARRDVGDVATELDPTTRLTLGKRLASNVDVTFSQSLRDGDAQTWIVEYLPRRRLEVRGVSDDDDLLSVGLRHEVSFGSSGGRSDEILPRPEPPRVARIELSGTLALSEARVRDELRLEPGDRFDFAEWQADRDRLEDLYHQERYLASRVTARRMENADGLALSYEIEAGPPTRIVVTGLDMDAALQSRLERAWVESGFDQFLIDEAQTIVREELARRRYLQPSVEVSIRDEGPSRILEIAVAPGQQSAQTIIRVNGASEEVAADVTAYLDSQGLVTRAILDPAAVEDSASVYLRSRGYLRAQVSAGAPLFEGTTAIHPVRVDAGPLFTIAAVEFEGTTVIPSGTLEEQAALSTGMPYAPTAVEAARQRLVALLRGEGFAQAAVAARADIAHGSPMVSVTFVITEGARQRLDAVVVVGNRAIDSDVVVRALGLSVGSPVRTEDVLQGRTRIFDTGLFRRIDVTSEPVDSGDSRVAPMRLRVTVEEWPSVRLRYGFVVAEERPEENPKGRELVPGLSADVTRRTLFGRGITVGMAVGLQRLEQSGRAFTSARSFLGLPLETSLVLERSRVDSQVTTSVTDLTGITWEQKARVAEKLTTSYAYTFRRDHTFETQPLPGSLPLDITANRRRLNTTQAWDSRDDFAEPTRGMLISSSFDLVNVEVLGSGDRFIRELAQAYYFRSWRDIVLASAARFGVVVPLGDSELFRQDLFVTGGSRTVRGVAEDSLAPVDFFGFPGGQTLIVLNQEVRLPLYRWIRGVTFLDAGNVFLLPGDADLRDLVGSIGFGVRVTTPFALLRADFGKTLWGLPASSSRWSFGIGHTF